MALIVEDGSGKPDAEALASVEQADDYHAKRANTAWAAKSVEAKEVALIKATDYLQDTLSGALKGNKAVKGQALLFPRAGMWRDHDDDELPSNKVPLEAVQATCELALLVVSGVTLMPQQRGRSKKSVKVGPVSVVYDDEAPRTVYVAAMAKLGPLMLPVWAGSGMIKLEAP